MGGSKPGDGSAKPSSLADALEALVTAGLFGQIKRQEAANNDPRNPSMYTMDTSLWLDSILQQGLPMSLASWSRGLAVDAMADDEIVNALRGPFDDLERAVRLLQAFPAEKQDVDKATRVLRGVHALVAHCVQPGATHITSLKHAVTFIGSGDLEQCFSQLSGASLFRHAWEAAKARVQRSAQDEIADAHVRKAISFLRDTRMPRLIEAPPGEASVDRGSARVEQCGLVFDMTVASVLVENLECASEALGIWSPVAMEEAGPLLAEWASTFIEALDVVSMTVTGRMQQVCARSWLAGYLQDSAAVDCGKDLDERAVEATLDIPPSTLRGFVPEGELRGLYKMILKLADKRAAPCFAAVAAQVRGLYLPMAGVRTAIGALLSAIVEAKHGGSSARELLDDWKQNGIRSDAVTKLDSMIAVRKATTSLEASVAYSDDTMRHSGITLQLFSGAEKSTPRARIDEHEPFTFVDLPTFATKVLALPMVQRACGRLRECVAVAVNDLVQELDFGGVAAALEAWGAVPAISLAELAAVLWGDRAIASMMLQAPCVGVGDKSALLVQRLWKLLQQLQETIDDESFEATGVDVLFLAGCGGGAAESSPTTLLLDELLALCEYYASLAVIVTAVSVVANLRVVRKLHVVDAERGAIALEHVNALRMISTASEQLRSAWPRLSQHIKAGWPLLLALERASRFLDVIHASAPGFFRHAVLALFAHAGQLTNVLAAMPDHSGYLNDEVCLKNMITRHLLKWPHRDALAANCIKLHATIVNMKGYHSNFGLLPRLHDDPELHPQTLAAEGQFRSAKRLVKIIAACSAVFETKGVCQESDCTEILKSGVDDLPKSLIPFLKCHASAEPTPATKKPRR